MLRVLSLAVCAAIAEEMAFDDDSLSLIQLRDDLSMAFEDPSVSLLQLRASEKGPIKGKLNTNGEYGNDVIARQNVDDNKCDAWEGPPWKRVFVNCNCEYQDMSLGAIYDGPGDMITGVRFYAAQAGNYGLRFRVYRKDDKLDTESQEIEVPKAGVIQEVTFERPLLFLYGDRVGWAHNGKGNIGYSEGPVFPDEPSWVAIKSSKIAWNNHLAPNDGLTEPWEKSAHGTCTPFLQESPEQHGIKLPYSTGAAFKRTYSYSLITRPATKADLPDKMCFGGGLNAVSPPQEVVDSLPDAAPPPPAPEPSLPDPAESDAAAAVGDPHLTTNEGQSFDMQ